MIDWSKPILTWEYFTLNDGGAISVEAGLISLDGRPFGSCFPDRKLLGTRNMAESLAIEAGAQFLAVPYTRALTGRIDATIAQGCCPLCADWHPPDPRSVLA